MRKVAETGEVSPESRCRKEKTACASDTALNPRIIYTNYALFDLLEMQRRSSSWIEGEKNDGKRKKWGLVRVVQLSVWLLSSLLWCATPPADRLPTQLIWPATDSASRAPRRSSPAGDCDCTILALHNAPLDIQRTLLKQTQRRPP